MSQPTFFLIYDLFSTVGKHISHVHVSFIFAKFNKHIKVICAKLVFFRFFPIFVSWFYQHTKGLSWQHQVQTHATHHFQSDPSWISLQANHLNSSNHRTWKHRFWKLVCTTRKSYGDGVQLFNNEVLWSRSLRERPAKFPMSIILCMLRDSPKHRRYQLHKTPVPALLPLTPVNKNFLRLLTRICFIRRWMSF